MDSSFIHYWQKYESEEEANREDKHSWSPVSMSAGIVRAAIESVAKLLTPKPPDGWKFTRTTGDFWVTSQPISFYDIRIHIIGVDILLGPLPKALRDEVAALSREALCLCVLPSTEQFFQGQEEAGSSDKPAAGIIPLYPNDVDALARGGITLAELIEYKLLREFFYEKPDPETQYHINLVEEYRRARDLGTGTCLREIGEAIKDTGEDPRTWVDHPLLPRVVRTVEGQRACLLIGPSSSGKSILAMQVARHFGLKGREAKYVNLGTVQKFPAGIVSTFLLTSAHKDPSLLVVDDLQSNVAGTRYIFAVSNIAQRARVGSALVMLAATWPDFGEKAAIWLENCLPFVVRPHQVSGVMSRRFGGDLASKDVSSIATRFGDDLLLLRLALEQSSKLGRKVSLAEVAMEIWRGRTDDGKMDDSDVRCIALVAGSLARYDIPSSSAFIREEARVSDETITKCISSRLLRRQSRNLTIGHRSLGALIADWLDVQGVWQNLSKRGGPKNTTSVVLDYLQSLGPTLAVDTLRALHARAGFKEKPKLNRIAAALVEVWTTFNAVAERIEQQQRIDPLWGRAPSSVMFAIQAFSELGKIDLIASSLEFLRGHWALENDQIRITTDGLSTQADFQKIHQEMSKEDESFKHAGYQIRMPTHVIDMERFHRTWLMGILMCAESLAEEPRIPLVQLARLAEKEQLASGAFYPERVPWSTARVLLGLAACGRTVDTSESVRDAVTWLLKDREEGGAQSNGIWRSGTGSWNSSLETTSLVLTALAAIGYDCSRSNIDAARDFLLSERSSWTAPGKELDGALAMQAYLETGGEWEEVILEAQLLSQWTRGESLWQGATLSSEFSLTQSCRVAQIATSLVSIGWRAIRSDLPAFLDALATPEAFRQELATEASRSVQVATMVDKNVMKGTMPHEVQQPNADALFGRLLSIPNPLLLNTYAVVGNYKRFEERTRNRLKDWRSRIERPLLEAGSVHQNFLIWAGPGSGKTFFVQEIAASLGDSIVFHELNLARDSKEDFVSKLRLVQGVEKPTLCLLDEIDTRADEKWPYEVIFPVLDLDAARPVVCVLIGSLSTGLPGMVNNIRSRWKGNDLVDRIPVHNRFEIPPATIEDRVCIFAAQARQAAANRGAEVSEIEKLAIYYALADPGLSSPRQLRDLARAAVNRMPPGERRLKYDDLFYSSDRQNQTFWVAHMHAAESLSEVYVGII
jgi:hypothetical protein